MAIKPNKCVNPEADASKFNIKDDTGVHVEDFNEGGFGSPNQGRSEFAIVLLAYYQGFDEEEVLINDIESNVDFSVAYTNDHKTSFEVPYSEDGWYKFYMVLVPTSITPIEGRIFYSTTLEKLVQYDSGLNPVNVTSYEILRDDTVYLQSFSEDIYDAKLSEIKNKLSREFLECAECQDCGCEEEREELIYLKEGIQSARSHFKISRFEAQRIVEKLTQKYRNK